MNNETLKMAKQISDWCLDNNSKAFTCFFNFSGHVNLISVRMRSGGYDNCHKEKDLDAYTEAGETPDGFLNEMKEFKAEHDAWFSPEAVAEQEEAGKVKRIASIKAELATLEASK